MASSGRGAGRWSFGQADPPLGIRIVYAAMCVVLAVGAILRVPLAVGVVVALLFGLYAVRGLFPWGRSRAWSLRHPFLQSLIAFPAAFVAVALITDFSVGTCALLAIPAGLVLAGAALAATRFNRPRG
jgi:hypothetical protein